MPALPSGRTAYYVSEAGDDSDPGTISQPWRTGQHAMAQSYTAGDQLLFERGGTFYTGPWNKTVTANGTNRWLVGAYGTGAKPILCAWKIVNNPASWSLFSTNVWRINIASSSTHTGWTDTTTFGAQNIGHLREGPAGTVHAVKRTSTGALANQWDFYTDATSNSTYLYVYSTSNPATLAPNLMAAPGVIMFRANSNTEINGVEITGTGSHAVRGESNASNVQIKNCNMHDLGGSFLIGFGDGLARFGNGVEIQGGSDWLIQGNEIAYCFDAGWTNQGGTTWDNIHVTQNFFHHNSFHIEMWSTSGTTQTDVVIDDNDMEDGGYGPFPPERAEQYTRCALVNYQLTGGSVDITVTNNRIKRCYGSYRYVSSSGSFPSDVICTNNDIQLASGTVMELGQSQTYTISNASSYRTARSTESGSTFTVL